MSAAAVGMPNVAEAEASLRRLLKSWRSRYRFIVLLKSTTKRVITFQTQWARKPTPHQPLPDIRVHVEFAYLYETSYNDKGEKYTLAPTLSYRIEHESLVHRDVSHNIDHHILRHLKFKSEFHARNPLPLTADQAEYFASRFQYEPLDVIADSHLGSFVDFADQATADRHLEKELIAMFQRADFDKNGSLDPEEFEDLLLNSKWGFTKADVAVVMTQHDANDDGKLVYSEFIPIAIDLVQAQRASAYAQAMTSNSTEAAYKSALGRIQKSKDLHRAMDSGLGQLDPQDTGSVRVGDLIELLRGIDMDLTDGEIGAIINRMKTLNKAAVDLAREEAGEPPLPSPVSKSTPPSESSTPSRSLTAKITYKVLQDNYEDLLLDAIQNYNLDKEASDVEIYLNGLFKKHDAENTGILDEKTLTTILNDANDRIQLSSTQIYAIIGDHKPSDGQFKYRIFARKAAHMILQLFNSSSVSERSTMIKRSSITPIQLLSDAQRTSIEAQMKSKFVEFDADNDGLLNQKEFAAMLADTGLVLSTTEIALLRTRADLNKDGMIDPEEWKKFSYETLLHLQRDAALKTQMSHVLKKQNEMTPTATFAAASPSQ